jgi:undecaprenyl-diphosphatase
VDTSAFAPGEFGGRTLLPVLLVMFAAGLAGFAAFVAAVVRGGWLVELDVDVASWVASSMPGWAEWLARPPTWLGGLVGTTLVVGAATVWLLRRDAAREAALLIVAAIGSQAVVLTAKELVGRHRPDVGSAIELPSSFGFPSGHAATGIAVFGLLGLLAANDARATAVKRAAALGGIAIGVAIGASRVVLNVHYVSDVLAGWCLGVACLAGCLLVGRGLRR